MPTREIILPETKPALEWIDGQIVQKVSPQRRHALAQAVFVSALQSWAGLNRSGLAGTEWECRIAPPGEVRRPLVPDVAYFSYERIPREEMENTDIPRVAPDVVVEVLSPRDQMRYIDSKVRTYLVCGTAVVFLVDTSKRTVTARSIDDVRQFTIDDSVEHPALPGFSMPARTLFELP